MLAPGLIESAGINWIKPEFVHQLHHNRLGIIPGNRQSDAIWSIGRTAVFHKMFGIDIVRCLDHGPPDLTLDPAALRQTRLNFVDPSFRNLIREGLPTTVQNRWILAHAAEPTYNDETLAYNWLTLPTCSWRSEVRSQRDSVQIGQSK